jgi:hypothetical protein
MRLPTKPKSMSSRVLGFLRRGQVLYELEKPRTSIGRAATNDIVLEAQVRRDSALV